MGKPAVLGRAVPVFDPGRNVHHVAGLERQRGLFPLLVPAASSGYEKNLPSFVVDVPGSKVTLAMATPSVDNAWR